MKKIVLLLFMLATFLASLGLADDTSISTAVMNSTQTLISELLNLIVTAVISIVAYYVKEFLQTNSFCKKYNLDNEKTERLLFNAISYAEANSKRYIDQQVTKRDLAIKYLEKVDPSTVSKYGDVLHDMLDRKVEQAKAEQRLRNSLPVTTPPVNAATIVSTGIESTEQVILDTTNIKP